MHAPKGIDHRFHAQQSLKNAVFFLISYCFFTVSNLVFKQVIGIPMRPDLAPFFNKSISLGTFINNLISLGSSRGFKCLGTGRFIDDLCTIRGAN